VLLWEIIGKDIMTELEILKKMLSDGYKEIRGSKKKTWPAFGVEMFLLQCIVQCNKALNEKNKIKEK
jgi:hypothetical protein